MLPLAVKLMLALSSMLRLLVLVLLLPSWLAGNAPALVAPLFRVLLWLCCA
jgi:hypothetical protein